jgi:hypothetical protein
MIGLCLASLASKAQVVAAAAAAGSALAWSQASHAALPTAAAVAVVPWQLQRVTGQDLWTPSMLESLSTCTSLTSLMLNLDEDSNEAALFKALGRMHQLLELGVHLPSKKINFLFVLHAELYQVVFLITLLKYPI